MTHTALASCDNLKKLLDEWVRSGWLRSLDRAMANFVYDEVLKEVNKQVNKKAQDKKSIEPLLILAATLVSHQAGRGHVCLAIDAILQDADIALAIPPELAGKKEVAATLPSQLLQGISTDAWLTILQNYPLVIGAGEGNTPLVLEGSRIYLRRYWQYEQQIKHALEKRLANPVAVDEEKLQTVLQKLYKRDEKTPAIDWQKIACALAARSSFSVMTGGPGTGKTTTVVKLLAVLQMLQLQKNNTTLTIRMAAPTGKAAARLNESITLQIDNLRHLLGETGDEVCKAIKADVSTLHRLLGPKPESRHFLHNAHHPLPADIVVIDEASMVDVEMMANVLEALPDTARLILLGDKDQLASVEAGAVLGKLCARANEGHYNEATAAWIHRICGEKVPTNFVTNNATALDQAITMLRHSHRFGEHSGIGKLSRCVNAGDVDSSMALLADGKDDVRHLRLKDENDHQLDALLIEGYAPCLKIISEGHKNQTHDAWAKSVLEMQGRFQMLCAVRRGEWGVEGMNRRAEQVLRSKNLLSADSEWYVGRPVIVTRNDYSLQLMNGDMGITLTNSDGEKRVVFADSDKPGGVHWVLPARLSSVETAFAMTVHKSQGSEFDKVAVLLPDKSNPVLTRELLYTGITRARQHFTLIDSSDTVLRDCISRCVQRV